MYITVVWVVVPMRFRTKEMLGGVSTSTGSRDVCISKNSPEYRNVPNKERV